MVESATEKVSGLIKLFSGYDMEVELEGTTARVKLPPGIYYASRNWLSMKPYITNSIFDDVADIEEIQYIETYKNTKKESEE
jgi:hypothetical protein